MAGHLDLIGDSEEIRKTDRQKSWGQEGCVHADVRPLIHSNLESSCVNVQYREELAGLSRRSLKVSRPWPSYWRKLQLSSLALRPEGGCAMPVSLTCGEGLEGFANFSLFWGIDPWHSLAHDHTHFLSTSVTLKVFIQGFLGPPQWWRSEHSPLTFEEQKSRNGY